RPSPAVAWISTIENFIVSFATIATLRPPLATGAAPAGAAEARTWAAGCSGLLQAATAAVRNSEARIAMCFGMIYPESGGSRQRTDRHDSPDEPSEVTLAAARTRQRFREIDWTG